MAQPIGDDGPLDPSALLLVVVGSHLQAEAHDRVVAYRLRQRMREWLDSVLERTGDVIGVTPLVCTDVWYLNDPSLRECATVSVGAPEVNALTAYLRDKLPGAYVVDDVLMVQLDVEFDQPPQQACCWGVNHEATGGAVEAFCERYLDAFMQAATRAWA